MGQTRGSGLPNCLLMRLWEEISARPTGRWQVLWHLYYEPRMKGRLVEIGSVEDGRAFFDAVD